MKMREWINKNSPLVTIGAVLVLIVCLFVLLRQINPPVPPPITKAWFFDLETNKLFIGPNAALPPIPTPSGKKDANGSDQGVRAIIFSCGQCSDESKRYIGYLETLTPEAKEQIQAMMDAASKVTPDGPPPPPPTQPMGDPMMNGRLIASPDKGGWLTMDSPDAGKLIQESMSKCGEGKYPTQCFPDM